MAPASMGGRGKALRWVLVLAVASVAIDSAILRWNKHWCDADLIVSAMRHVAKLSRWTIRQAASLG